VQNAVQNLLKTAKMKSCLKQKGSFQSDSQFAAAPTSKASNTLHSDQSGTLKVVVKKKSSG
jgi:hypothetical protein